MANRETPYLGPESLDVLRSLKGKIWRLATGKPAPEKPGHHFSWDNVIVATDAGEVRIHTELTESDFEGYSEEYGQLSVHRDAEGLDKAQREGHVYFQNFQYVDDGLGRYGRGDVNRVDVLLRAENVHDPADGVEVALPLYPQAYGGRGRKLAQLLGFSYQILQLVRGLHGLNVIGFDLVEVSPAYDHGDITSILAANLAFEFLSLLASRRASAKSAVKKQREKD